MARTSFYRFAFIWFVASDDLSWNLSNALKSVLSDHVRNTGNDRQLIDLMEISSLCGSHRAALIAWFPGQGALWLDGSIIILLRFIAVPKSCFGFWSFIFTAGVWLPWLTRFYTARRIKVFPVLLFCFQGSVGGFFAPLLIKGMGGAFWDPYFRNFFIFFFACSIDFRICLYDTFSISAILRSVKP